MRAPEEKQNRLRDCNAKHHQWLLITHTRNIRTCNICCWKTYKYVHNISYMRTEWLPWMQCIHQTKCHFLQDETLRRERARTTTHRTVTIIKLNTFFFGAYGGFLSSSDTWCKGALVFFFLVGLAGVVVQRSTWSDADFFGVSQWSWAMRARCGTFLCGCVYAMLLAVGGLLESPFTYTNKHWVIVSTSARAYEEKGAMARHRQHALPVVYRLRLCKSRYL